MFQTVREAPLLWVPLPLLPGALGSEILVGGPGTPREGFLVLSSIQTLLSLSHPTLHPLRVHQDLSSWQNRTENCSPSHQRAPSHPPLFSLPSTHPLLVLACLPLSPFPLAPESSAPQVLSLQLDSWGHSRSASLKTSAGLSVPASLHPSLAFSLLFRVQVTIVSELGAGRRDGAVVACSSIPTPASKGPSPDRRCLDTPCQHVSMSSGCVDHMAI